MVYLKINPFISFNRKNKTNKEVRHAGEDHSIIYLPLFFSEQKLNKQVNTVYVTTDRNRFIQADIVIFYLPALVEEIEEEIEKMEDQIWVAWYYKDLLRYDFFSDGEFLLSFDLFMTDTDLSVIQVSKEDSEEKTVHQLLLLEELSTCRKKEKKELQKTVKALGNIYLCSFSDSRFINSLERLWIQAQEMDIFENRSGLLLSQLSNEHLEYRWTKEDVLNYFDLEENSRIVKTPQLQSGIIFIRKIPGTLEMVRKWASGFVEDFRLVDDSPSRIPNFSGFRAHRHDQSILSILARKQKASTISVSEFYTESNWESRYKSYPILIKRDL